MESLPGQPHPATLYVVLCAAGMVALVAGLAWIEIASEPDPRRQKILLAIAALRAAWMVAAVVCWVGWNIGTGTFWIAGFIVLSAVSEILRRRFLKKQAPSRLAAPPRKD